LVQQRNDRLVLDCLIKRVSRADAPAEVLDGWELRVENWSAREADEAGTREDATHGGVKLSGMAAVAFVDQDEDVRAIEHATFDVHGGFELLQQRRDDLRARTLKQLDQMPPGYGLRRTHAAGDEGSV